MKRIKPMSAMQILKSLDKKYQHSTFKVKAQLYLLPVLLVVLIILLSPNKSKASASKKLINYDSLKMQENLLDIINSIEAFGSKNKIKFAYIKSSNKTISLNANSSFSSMKKFISFVDNLNTFSNIDELNIIKNKNKYSYSINIDFNRFYLKNKLTKEKNTKKVKSKTFRLKAIVSKNVLINTNWLKEGEYIEGYEIKEILLNEVVLKKEDKTIKLKVFKNDKYNE